MMKWQGYGRKRSWPDLRYYPGIFVEGLRKTTKNLSQESRSLSRDLNSGPADYVSRSVKRWTTTFGGLNLAQIVDPITTDLMDLTSQAYRYSNCVK
jgi:hypothetical protein